MLDETEVRSHAMIPPLPQATHWAQVWLPYDKIANHFMLIVLLKPLGARMEIT
jgi:hypothetical protein